MPTVRFHIGSYKIGEKHKTRLNSGKEYLKQEVYNRCQGKQRGAELVVY